MSARAFWLGPAPLFDAEALPGRALPDQLMGALVVQPSPLLPHELRALLADVRARGGRLAAELGSEPPLGAEVFQFSAELCGCDELRRQFESMLAEPDALFPRRARFTFRSYRQVELVAHATAALLTRPERRVPGLVELLLNACEHGNLEIRGEKQALLAAGRWADELERRERLAPWSSRQVIVEVERASDGQTVTITDEGAGFDHAARRAGGHFHGRGLEIARELSFDGLEFKGRGNCVVAKVRP